MELTSGVGDSGSWRQGWGRSGLECLTHAAALSCSRNRKRQQDWVLEQDRRKEEEVEEEQELSSHLCSLSVPVVPFFLSFSLFSLSHSSIYEPACLHPNET